MKTSRHPTGLIVGVLLPLVVASCPFAPVGGDPARPPAPSGQPARVCDNQLPGPATAPAGAVIVDPAVDGDVAAKNVANPPGTMFWLAPGTHTLGRNEFGQIIPKDGNTYLGAPGAVLDGRGINGSAFTQQAKNVTIRHLTIQGFVAQPDQGVVNHDSGDGWVIEHNTIQHNSGAGMMAGARQQVRGNCLRNNGQYGMNAYQAGNTITGLVVEGNEIVGNNTGDWERRSPGCGCTGGVKLWAVNRADIRNNWVHDNRSAGLWADNNNNDLLVEGNVIEANDGEAIFLEQTYNTVVRNNTIRNNTWVTGREFAHRGDNFPVAAIYLSESGGEPRVPARTSVIEITGNVLENNWSGITLWENADRFCNSPANTGTDCTRLVPSPAQCSQPGIASKPLYDDCRWKTQRVDVHDNTFTYAPSVVGCAQGFAGRMAMLSNFGTFPDWSPYQGTVIQEAISRTQDNRWRNNSYTGPWTFLASNVGVSRTAAQWQAGASKQDVGSTFSASPGSGC